MQLNCLACHQREGDRPRGQRCCRPACKTSSLAVAEAHGDLGQASPRDDAAGTEQRRRQAARRGAGRRHQPRKAPPHRPYLLVQMPKFNLTDDQLAVLTAYFTATDRIPPWGRRLACRSPKSAGETPAPRLCSPPARASSPPTAWPARAATRSARVLPTRPRSTPAGRTCRCSTSASAANGSTAGATTRRGSSRGWKCPRCKVPVRGVLERKNRRPARRRLAHSQHPRLRAPRAQPRPRPPPLRRARAERTPDRHPRRLQRRRQDLPLSRSSSACPTATTSSSTSKPTASPPGGSATRPGSGRRGRAGTGRWVASRFSTSDSTTSEISLVVDGKECRSEQVGSIRRPNRWTYRQMYGDSFQLDQRSLDAWPRHMTKQRLRDTEVSDRRSVPTFDRRLRERHRSFGAVSIRRIAAAGSAADVVRFASSVRRSRASRNLGREESKLSASWRAGRRDPDRLQSK